VVNADIIVPARTLHCADRPERRRQATAFNLISGMFAPDKASSRLPGKPSWVWRRKTSRARASAARSRSPICSAGLPVEENMRLAVQARQRRALRLVASAQDLSTSMPRPRRHVLFLAFRHGTR